MYAIIQKIKVGGQTTTKKGENTMPEQQFSEEEKESALTLHAYFESIAPSYRGMAERAERIVKELENKLAGDSRMLARFNTICGYRDKSGELLFVVAPNEERGIMQMADIDEYLGVPRYEPDVAKKWMSEQGNSELVGDANFINSLQKTTMSEREFATEVMEYHKRASETTRRVVDALDEAKPALEDADRELFDWTTQSKIEKARAVVSVIKSEGSNKEQVAKSMLENGILGREPRAVATVDGNPLTEKELSLLSDARNSVFTTLVETENDLDIPIGMALDDTIHLADCNKAIAELSTRIVEERGDFYTPAEILSKNISIKSYAEELIDGTSLNREDKTKLKEAYVVQRQKDENAKKKKKQEATAKKNTNKEKLK